MDVCTLILANFAGCSSSLHIESFIIVQAFPDSGDPWSCPEDQASVLSQSNRISLILLSLVVFDLQQCQSSCVKHRTGNRTSNLQYVQISMYLSLPSHYTVLFLPHQYSKPSTTCEVFPGWIQLLFPPKHRQLCSHGTTLCEKAASMPIPMNPLGHHPFLLGNIGYLTGELGRLALTSQSYPVFDGDGLCRAL